MNEYKKRAILIGAGDMAGLYLVQGSQMIKDGSLPANDKNETEYEDIVIALDGGLIYCEENSILPDYIIGDFDSLPQDKLALLDKYPQECIQRLPREKDDTDMLAAIKFAATKGVKDFVIYGGLGGRLSHTIANIQCLMYLKEWGMTGILLGRGTKAFLLKNEEYSFNEKENGYISVFSYSNSTSGVTLKNLKYELEDADLTVAFPLGVSNEFVAGKAAQISVKEGVLLVIMEKQM